MDAATKTQLIKDVMHVADQARSNLQSSDKEKHNQAQRDAILANALLALLNDAP